MALNRRILCLGALLAGGGVALGAFGAHGLEQRLTTLGYENVAQRLAWFDTGVRYQLFHALALIVVAGLPLRCSTITAVAFAVGIALFSGSLYVMTFAGPAWIQLGMVVPLGGLAFLIGWTALAVYSWRGVE